MLSIPAQTTVETIESSDLVSPSGATLQSKIDNERLRAKIDSAVPPEYEDEPAPKSGGFLKFLSWLLLFLLGAAAGAGALYAWYEYQRSINPAPIQQPITQPQTTRNTAAPTSDLTAAEINEFRTFERTRRSVDDRPNDALNAAAPQTSADYYLRARAFLQTGKNEEALQALKKAEELLPQAADVDRETLRVDLALAYGALAAMANNGSQKRMLSDLINEKKAGSTSTEVQTPLR
jgi:tetratricopeptide (TPR) repeat protein